MQFEDLRVGDIFKLVSSYPMEYEPEFMKIDMPYRAVYMDGLLRGQTAVLSHNSSVEVTDISHG